MTLYHAYNQTVGDGTATSVVRPSDWNSGHNQFVTLAGNTAGASTISGTNIVYQGGNNVTLSGTGSTIIIQGANGGGGGYTGLTYNNRQLGASAATSGQNSVWLCPMRLANAVSVSTLLQMVSISGGSTTNTGSVGITYRLALYQNTATSNASRMDQIWSTSMGITGYMSSSNSAAYSFNGGASGQVSSIASANSNVLSQISGVRQITFLLNTIFDTGLYAFGYVISTSSVGNSAAIRSFAPIIDNPMALGLGAGFGGATNNSIGYVDAGTYSVTSNNMPTSFLLQDIRQTANVVPYVKMGAI
jgi:hypothetical protein